MKKKKKSIFQVLGNCGQFRCINVMLVALLPECRVVRGIFRAQIEYVTSETRS